MEKVSLDYGIQILGDTLFIATPDDNLEFHLDNIDGKIKHLDYEHICMIYNKDSLYFIIPIYGKKLGSAIKLEDYMIDDKIRLISMLIRYSLVVGSGLNFLGPSFDDIITINTEIPALES
jgi:hypothetical protein